MSVTTTHVKDIFQGNGEQKSFPFSFEILEKSQIKCLKVLETGEEIEILNAEIEVNLNETTGGTVVYPVSGDALSSDERLIVYRFTDVKQDYSPVNSQNFDANAIKKEIDRLTMQNQEQEEQLNRSVKVSISGDGNPDDLMKEMNEKLSATTAEADRATEQAEIATTAKAETIAAIGQGLFDYEILADEKISEYNENHAEKLSIIQEKVDVATEQADRADEIVSHIIPNSHTLGEIFTDGFVDLLEGQGWCQGDVLPSGAYSGLVEQFDKYNEEVPLPYQDGYYTFENAASIFYNKYNVLPDIALNVMSPTINGDGLVCSGGYALKTHNFISANEKKWFYQGSFILNATANTDALIMGIGSDTYVPVGIKITDNILEINTQDYTPPYPFNKTYYTLDNSDLETVHTLRHYFDGETYYVDYCNDWNNTTKTGSWINIHTLNDFNSTLYNLIGGYGFHAAGLGGGLNPVTNGFIGELANLYIRIGSDRIINTDLQQGIANIPFATYEASLLANNNNCILFGYDAVNGLIRLPTIQDGVGIFQANTIAENNKFYNDQIQNITGTFKNFGSNGGLDGFSGAFYAGTTQGGSVTGSNTNSNNALFDASRVVRAGNETRNKQIRRRYKVQLANVGISASESQYAEFVDGLTNKADKDLDNTIPSQAFKEQSVGWGMPDYSAGITITSGYTATQKGLATVGMDGSNHITSSVYINGIKIGHSTAGNQYQEASVNAQIPLDVGDEISWTGTQQVIAMFFPFKGV
ncbi:MAG: hypothetical protein PHE89_02615 [Alphaproteobacteria bacterium]|nr:hypothetical protein [Alphaproteobacteria bacterium]